MPNDEAAPEGKVSDSKSEGEPADVEQTVDAADAGAHAEPEATSEPSEEAEESAAEASDVADTEDAADEPAPAKPRMSHVKLAMIAGLVVVLALAGLTGWLGYRAYESYKAEADRNLFLQVGRQGALNLTTIDHQRAEEDVQRVLDSATGSFYDEFQGRSQPFIEVVKQAQSKSVGTIGEAGLESVSGDQAQVIVAVTVNTSNAGAPEQQPRAWRMRLTVEKVDDEAKVSNVEFVP